MTPRDRHMRWLGDNNENLAGHSWEAFVEHGRGIWITASLAGAEMRYVPSDSIPAIEGELGQMVTRIVATYDPTVQCCIVFCENDDMYAYRVGIAPPEGLPQGLLTLVNRLGDGDALDELDDAIKLGAFPGTDRFGSRFALFLPGADNSVFGWDTNSGGSTASWFAQLFLDGESRRIGEPNVWPQRGMPTLADLVGAIGGRASVDRLAVCQAMAEGLRIALDR